MCGGYGEAQAQGLMSQIMPPFSNQANQNVTSTSDIENISKDA